MYLFYPTLAVQFDLLGGAIGVAIAIVVSFALITFIASYFRFQHIVEIAEQTNPEEMGTTHIDIIRIQLARYLAGCARRGTSFSFVLVHVDNPAMEVSIGSPLFEAFKDALRKEDMVSCYDEHTAALFIESDPDDKDAIIKRVMNTISQTCPELELDQLRAGIASYPGHGVRGMYLIEVAERGLALADRDQPIVMPDFEKPEEKELEEDSEDEADEIVEDEYMEDADEDQLVAASQDSVDEDDDEDEEDDDDELYRGGYRRRRKASMLDELTGVLKPSAISPYMQRMMSELRRQKKKASLFCVGVNNMEHIVRYHGVLAANDILAGVSQILQDNLRSDDLIGRHEQYGFLVLSEIPLSDAEVIGKRLSTLVQQAEFKSGANKLKTTITLGVSAHPEHGRNLHQLYVAGQKVLDYGRENDIRAYAVYDDDIHDKVPAKPMKSIKSIQA